MAAGNGSMDSQPDEIRELYRRARAARQQSQFLRAQSQAVRQDAGATSQLSHAAGTRADQVREMLLAARTGRLRYSAYARLQAKLDSMPVIEQAKGIIMAQCGWPEDQAFDALRRASQRENVKLRDLAAKVVATAARPAPAQPESAPAAHQQDRSRAVSVPLTSVGTGTLQPPAVRRTAG